MKRTILLGFVGLASIALAGCGDRIRFDEAAVEVVEMGSNAGVQEAEITTGRYWVAPWSYRYIVKFPKTIQTYRWTEGSGFQFINEDRVITGQRASMNIRINPADADNIVRKYKGSISNNGGADGYVLDDVVNGPIMREIQDAFTKKGVNYTSAELYKDGGAALLQDVKSIVGPKFAKDGIIIEDFLSAGPPSLPTDIVAAIKGSLLAAEVAKRKDAELASTIAEGKKTVAEAEAAAKAREFTAASIRASPEILKLEEIQRRGKSICPIGVTTCVIGGSALVQTR